MRNFDELTGATQQRIIGEYLTGKLTKEQAETVYNFDYGSLLDYLTQKAQADRTALNPQPKEEKLSIWEQTKIGLQQLANTVLADGIVKLTSIFFLFWLCTNVPSLLADDTDPLTLLNVQKAGIAALIYVVGKVFFEVFSLLMDRQEWKYSTPFIHPEFSFNTDYQSLTPYQRCVLSIGKRTIRLFLFCVLFWAVMSS